MQSVSANSQGTGKGQICNLKTKDVQGVHRDAYKSKLKFQVEKIIRN